MPEKTNQEAFADLVSAMSNFSKTTNGNSSIEQKPGHPINYFAPGVAMIFQGLSSLIRENIGGDADILTKKSFWEKVADTLRAIADFIDRLVEIWGP